MGVGIEQHGASRHNWLQVGVITMEGEIDGCTLLLVLTYMYMYSALRNEKTHVQRKSSSKIKKKAESSKQ